MPTMDDFKLLREYATRNSQEAFAALVQRHIGMVYSAALRQLRDPHLAEEVTQVVFIILAKKAGELRENTILSGWLYRTTRFACADALKKSQRRQRREQEAYMQSTVENPGADSTWQEIEPHLDDALTQLGETDRNALVLRFFENQNLREVGLGLGVSEVAAQKRITRALEKLRALLLKRETVLPVSILIATLSANAAQAAPAGLAATVATTAAVKGVAAGASILAMVKGTIKIMTWAKLKLTIGASTAVLLVGSLATVALPMDESAAQLPVATSKKLSEKSTTLPVNQPIQNRTSSMTSAVSNSDNNDLSPTNIIAKVRLAYSSLSTYRDTAWTINEYNGNAWTNTSTVMLGGRNCYKIETISALRPYRNIDRYWSDGLASYHQNTTIVGDRRHSGSTSKNSDLMGHLTSSSDETLVPTLFFSLSWRNIFTPLMLGPIAELVRHQDDKVGEVDCYVIGRTEAVGSSNAVREVTLWVGKEDFLVRRWRDFNSPLQADAKPRIRTETHENIVINEEFNREDYAQPFPKP